VAVRRTTHGVCGRHRIRERSHRPMPLLPVLSKGLAQPAGSPKGRSTLREQLRVDEHLLSEVA